MERFISELVVPFFYRLAYIDRFGLSAAREDLWESIPTEMPVDASTKARFSSLPTPIQAETDPAPVGVG